MLIASLRMFVNRRSWEKYGNGQGAEISTLDSEAHVGCDGIDIIDK